MELHCWLCLSVCWCHTRECQRDLLLQDSQGRCGYQPVTYVAAAGRVACNIEGAKRGWRPGWAVSACAIGWLLPMRACEMMFNSVWCHSVLLCRSVWCYSDICKGQHHRRYISEMR